MSTMGYSTFLKVYIDRLVQERCNSSALAMELWLSCTNRFICGSQCTWDYCPPYVKFSLQKHLDLLWAICIFFFHMQYFLPKYSFCLLYGTFSFTTHLELIHHMPYFILKCKLLSACVIRYIFAIICIICGLQYISLSTQIIYVHFCCL